LYAITEKADDYPVANYHRIAIFAVSQQNNEMADFIIDK